MTAHQFAYAVETPDYWAAHDTLGRRRARKRPPQLSGSTLLVPLTQGKVAMADPVDFDLLRCYTWCFSKGYAATHARGGERHIIQMHNLLLLPPPGFEVDHIDRDPLNNRRSNLRLATRTQNNGNTSRRGGTSIFKGVSRGTCTSKPWRAQIKYGGKNLFIGQFSTPEEAARAYDAKALALFGTFACTNAMLELL